MTKRRTRKAGGIYSGTLGAKESGTDSSITPYFRVQSAELRENGLYRFFLNKRILYFIVIVLVFAAAAFLRIWYLDRIPAGIVSDELEYVLNADAAYHTGHGIASASWSPWSFTTAPHEIPKAEFPYLVSLPFVGPFGLSLFTARIGYALISIIYVATVLLLATAFFGPWSGVAAGALAAINPWSVYYGRTAYDVPVAITAYLLSLYMIWRYRGPKLLLAVIPLGIAFYSYIGTKILFLPFLLVTIPAAWYLSHRKKNTGWLALVALAGIAIFSVYVFQIRALDTGQRIGQLFTPFDRSVISTVNGQRRLVLANPLTNLFANKAVVYTKLALVKMVGAFSPSILFTNGEGMATFSLWEHGLFYPIDALFLIAGAGILIGQAPLLFVFLLALMLIATLPSVLSVVGVTYVHRSSLMYPILTILMGYGLAHIIRSLRRSWRFIGILAVSGAYSLLVANFVFLYFFRFPYYNSEAFGLSQRVYSRYMALSAAKGIKVVNVAGSSSAGYFRNYLFYNNIPSKRTIPGILQAFENGDFRWGNASFTGNCPSDREIASGAAEYILSDTSPCKSQFINRPMISIPTLADGGMIYMIFNDALCSRYALSSYPTGFTMRDFDIEHLSDRHFCEKFLVRYNEPLYRPQDKNGQYIIKE